MGVLGSTIPQHSPLHPAYISCFLAASWSPGVWEFTFCGVHLGTFQHHLQSTEQHCWANQFAGPKLHSKGNR